MLMCKILVILLCCYLLNKYLLLNSVCVMGEAIGKKPKVGVMHFIKQDFHNNYITDSHFIEDIAYILALICIFVFSPIVLIFGIYVYLRIKNIIKNGYIYSLITHIKSQDPYYFIDIFGEDI